MNNPEHLFPSNAAPNVPEGYGTRKNPRIVEGILGPGGGGQRVSTGVLNGAQVLGQVAMGTQEQPREVTTSDADSLRRSARMSGQASVHRLGAVRTSVSSDARGAVSSGPVRVSSGAGAVATVQSGAPPSRADGRKFLAPTEGERIVVIPKGAAESIRAFLKTGAPVRKHFVPAIMRCMGDALVRPKDVAAPWGIIEVAVSVRREDWQALSLALRRVRPSGEVRARLAEAFDQAFQRDNVVESDLSPPGETSVANDRAEQDTNI